MRTVWQRKVFVCLVLFTKNLIWYEQVVSNTYCSAYNIFSFNVHLCKKLKDKNTTP